MRRKLIKLVTKALLRLEHHTGTSNGIIKEKCGGKNETLGGTGQGKNFSGVACRYIPCIVFRML